MALRNVQAEPFSTMQLRVLVTILDAGEQARREYSAAGMKWSGQVRWRPGLWFPDARKDAMSRMLRRLADRGYVERYQPSGAEKKIGRGWMNRTQYVRLTIEGFRTATDAKFGRIRPTDAERGE